MRVDQNYGEVVHRKLETIGQVRNRVLFNVVALRFIAVGLQRGSVFDKGERGGAGGEDQEAVGLFDHYDMICSAVEGTLVAGKKSLNVIRWETKLLD